MKNTEEYVFQLCYGDLQMTPEKIKEIRINMAVSQEKFAALLGTTAGTVNRWERGKVNPSRMSVKELKILEKNLGSYLCRQQ